jgi:hypothetical protein
MSVEHEKLQATLNQLREQLQQARELDPAIAEHLKAVIGEANDALAGRPAHPDHSPLNERLSDAVLKVEASHPDLAMNLGSIIDALGRMGI